MPFEALSVDDQEDVRTLFRMVIEAANRGLFVRGAVSSGEEAVSRIDELDPDVVVMDQMMPGMDGIEATRAIRERRPGEIVIMCSAHLDDELMMRARDAGIEVFLTKNDVGALPDVLHAFASG